MLNRLTKLAAVSALIISAQAALAQVPDYTDSDLLAVRSRILSRFGGDAVERHNQAMIASLPKPAANSTRVQSVSREFAENLMRSIDMNPITSYWGMDKYNRVTEGVNIGYCFGRATYGHLALLKNGVDKNAIRKIWAVGPMKTGATSWAFHVSTIVRADNGEWLAVDNFPGQVLNIQKWMEYVKRISTDGKLTFFITNPEKFSVSLGTYDRVQLGLDIGRNQDWYKHYFADLMKWFGSEQSRPFFDENGVPDLRKVVKPANSVAPEAIAAPTEAVPSVQDAQDALVSTDAQ